MRFERFLRLNSWREISILMLMIMEVSWVTPWFRSLTSATYALDPLRVFGVILGTVLFSHILVRSMNYARIKKTFRQGLLVVFILIAIFGSIKILLYAKEPTSLGELLNQPLSSFGDLRSLIPAEFIVIVTILVAFWRGISIAQEHIGPSSVKDHFWLGIAMYVVFVFINTLATGETPEGFFFLFLFAALIAMVAARISVIGMLRGGNEYKLNRSWLVGMVLAALFVVALSALLGGMVGNHFSWIGAIFLGIFGAVMLLLWLLIGPVVSLLISLLQKVFNTQGLKDLLDSFQNLNQTLLGLGQNIFDKINDSPLSRFFERLAPALRTVIFTGIIVLLIAGVVAWMAIRLWQDRARRTKDGEQKSSLQAGNLLQRLLDLLRGGLGNAIQSLYQLADSNHRQRLRAAARIRQVYADLMDLCAALGQPRDEAQTPLEFLPRLSQLFPQLELESAVITEAYNCIRYGQLPETRQDVEEVEEAWKKISSAGREISAEQKQHNKKRDLRKINP